MKSIVASHPQLESSLRTATGEWVQYEVTIAKLNETLQKYIEKSEAAAVLK